MKGTHHSRTRCLKRKNRRHHGLSAERSGPGKIDSTVCRRLIVADLRNTITFYATGVTRPINRLSRVRMANDIVNWFQWLRHQYPP
jgi:hypothetical protein